MTDQVSLDTKKPVEIFKTDTKETESKKEEIKQETSLWESVKAEAKETGKWWYNGIKNSDLADVLRGDFKSAVSKWKTGISESDIAHFLRGDFKGGVKIVVDSNRDWERGLGLTIVKNPAKQEFKKLEARVDDGDDKTLTTAEKAVEVAKTFGKVADAMTTPAGLAATVLAPAALGATGTAAKAGVIKTASTLATHGATRAAAVVSALPAATSAGLMVGGTTTAVVGAGQVVIADTKEEVQSGTTKVITGAGLATLGASMAPGAVEVAKAGGIPVQDGASAVKQVFQIPANAVTTPTSEIQANALTHATGVIQPGATVLKQGVHQAQANSPAREVYKFDPNAGATPDEVLAKNPYVSYDAEKGQYFVKTSWGENMYIDSNKNYMIAKYGEGDYNAIEGAEFARTYVEPEAYNATGAKNFIDPAKLKPGERIMASKAESARFKVMPEGTKYMSAEGPATLQKDSVIMIDKKGRPYQNTIDFLLKNNKGFSDEAMKDLYPMVSSRAADLMPQNYCFSWDGHEPKTALYGINGSIEKGLIPDYLLEANNRGYILTYPNASQYYNY